MMAGYDRNMLELQTDRQADMQTNSAFISLCIFYVIIMIIKDKH